ncbi:MAG: peptidoglycan bridge formation glycyltransferase FemA/FemB family protein [Spirochaeta sp.]|nr:peptidoglycan bridge formation glycyltransferase FemA/FemB family protein [Spirochaeta sp.]
MRLRLQTTDTTHTSTQGLPVAENLLQSEFWARFKALRGHEVFRFAVNDGNERAPLRALSRRLGPDTYGVYVPHGPEIEPGIGSEGQQLEALAEQLREQLPSWCVAVRFDLPWRSPYIEPDYFDEVGEWQGPPAARVRELRMNFGTEARLLRKAPTDLQPPDTVIVDLSISEQQLLTAMKSKTRYNIGLATRRGVRVRAGRERELDTFYRLYKETALRQGITAEDIQYFIDLFYAAKDPHGELDTGGATRPALYFAEYKQRPLAAAIVLHHSTKAYYLYGGSSSEDRQLMPSHLLQWQAMRAARNAGCRSYDLFGLPPNSASHHPMHGLYQFKLGFPGRMEHYRGCWDYPFQPDRYDFTSAVTGVESNSYHQ